MRIAAGVSTVELGSAIGMAQSHVSRLENAKVELNLSVLYRIAEALKVDPRDLLDVDGRSTVQFASVKGTVFSGEVYRPPYELVALPVRMRVDAFRYRDRSYFFAETAYPAASDDMKTWLVRYALGAEERIAVAIVENGGTPEAGFFIQRARPENRWLPVADPRLLESWRVVAQFENPFEGSLRIEWTP